MSSVDDISLRTFAAMIMDWNNVYNHTPADMDTDMDSAFLRDCRGKLMHSAARSYSVAMHVQASVGSQSANRAG